MPPRKRQRSAASTAGFASPPNRGTSRVSARLQSLYTGDKRLGDGIDYVRASRDFKVRRWEKQMKTFGGPGPQSFSVPRWQPIGPISMDLQSIKDRPPPSVKRNARRRRLEQDRASSPHPSSVGDENEERESVPNPADLFSELAAHHADSHQIKGDPGGEPPNP